MSMSKLEAYKALKLTQDATDTEIRAAYKSLARQLHPDKVDQSNREEALNKFQGMTLAYKTLTGTESDIASLAEKFKDPLYLGYLFSALVQDNKVNDISESSSDDDNNYENDGNYEPVKENGHAKQVSSSNNRFGLLIGRQTNAITSSQASGLRKSTIEHVSESANELVTAEELLRQRENNQGDEKKRKKKEKKMRKKLLEVHTAKSSLSGHRHGNGYNGNGASSSVESDNHSDRSETTAFMEEETNDLTSGFLTSHLKSGFLIGQDQHQLYRPQQQEPDANQSDPSSMTPYTQPIMQQLQYLESREPPKPKPRPRHNFMQQQQQQQPAVASAESKAAARELAKAANSFVEKQKLENALELYGRAIGLDPGDCRYYGSRAACLYQLNRFQECLRDADTAVRLNPVYPRGLYIRGLAQLRLDLPAEACISFSRLLVVDPNSVDATAQLNVAKRAQLESMGFRSDLCVEALKRFNGSVEQAADWLMTLATAASPHPLAPAHAPSALETPSYTQAAQAPAHALEMQKAVSYTQAVQAPAHALEMQKAVSYTQAVQAPAHALEMQKAVSYTQAVQTPAHALEMQKAVSYTQAVQAPAHKQTIAAASYARAIGPTAKQHQKQHQQKPAASQDEQQKKQQVEDQQQQQEQQEPPASTALWVGNVMPDVTDEQLCAAFSRHGSVVSARLLRQSCCAFVNMRSLEDSRRALAGLNGQLVGSRRLLVKYSGKAPPSGQRP